MNEVRVEQLRSQTMEKKSNDELLSIVTDTSPPDYGWIPEAIEAARRVLNDRYSELTEAQRNDLSQVKVLTQTQQKVLTQTQQDEIPGSCLGATIGTIFGALIGAFFLGFVMAGMVREACIYCDTFFMLQLFCGGLLGAMIGGTIGGWLGWKSSLNATIGMIIGALIVAGAVSVFGLSEFPYKFSMHSQTFYCLTLGGGVVGVLLGGAIGRWFGGKSSLSATIGMLIGALVGVFTLGLGLGEFGYTDIRIYYGILGGGMVGILLGGAIGWWLGRKSSL